MKKGLIFVFCLVLVISHLSLVICSADDMIWNGPADRRVVALTFDDGPKIEGSPAILDILYQHGVKATFFVVGSEVEQNPDIVFRMHDYGHEVANHFHSNERLKDIAQSRAISGILKTNESVRGITGETPRFFRPPGGSVPAYISREILAIGMRIVGWSINAEDYTEFTESFEIEKNYREAADILKEKVVSEARPGAIVLLHNGSKQTIMALPEIIVELRKNGYGFVTVSELLEGGV